MRKIDKLFAIGFALSSCFVINQGYQACKAEETKDIEVVQNNDVIIWEYLKSLGYSETARSAIMANIYEESRCNPSYIQGDRTFEQFVKGAMGIGICQWTSPSKQTELFNFAKEKGKDWTDLNLQLDFLTDDIVEEEWLNGAFKNIEEFKATDNLDKATTAFMQGYIKPTNIEVEKVKDRLDKAKEILAKYGEDIPVMASKTEDATTAFMQGYIKPTNIEVEKVKDRLDKAKEILAKYGEDIPVMASKTEDVKEIEGAKEEKAIEQIDEKQQQEEETKPVKEEEKKEQKVKENETKKIEEPKAKEVKKELPAIVEKVSNTVTVELSEGVKEADKKGESLTEMPTVYVATEENNRPQYTWVYSGVGLVAIGLGYLYANHKGYIDQIEDRIILAQYRKQCNNRPQYTWVYSGVGLVAIGLGYLYANHKGYIDQIEDRIILAQYRKQCQSKRSK